MKRIFSAAVILVSLSGWGALYYYAAHLRPAEEERFGKLLSEIEYKWKFQASLKQEEEAQKQNIQLVRQGEFERQVEEAVTQFREQIRGEFDDRYAAAEKEADDRQAERLGKEDAARREFNDSVIARIEKNDALYRAENAKLQEDVQRRIGELADRLQKLTDEKAAAWEKEFAALKSQREKDRNRIAALGVRLKELEASRTAAASAVPAPVTEGK